MENSNLNKFNQQIEEVLGIKPLRITCKKLKIFKLFHKKIWLPKGHIVSLHR